MKKFISIFLAAMICTALTGCNNSTSANTEATEVETIIAEEKTQTTKKIENKQTTTTQAKSEKSETDIYALSDIVAKDIEDTLDALNSEYEQLKAEVNTYDKYLSSTNKMEDFYDKIYEEHKNLCIRMREYSIDYVEMIINSDMSYDDMYNELDELYDNVYDDAGDDIYDGVYDGILDEIYDDFYDGILDIDYDEIDNYKEWSNAHSDEYKLWSHTRSDVYGDWSDFRSDVYGFWSDVRSALWNDDIEKAEKKIEKLQKSIDRLNGVKSTDTEIENVVETTVTEEEKTSVAAPNGIRPEFKEALDSYEAFFDEYCDIMKKYIENPLDMSILMEYYEYIEKAEEMDEKLEALDDGEMSDEELAYYLEVTARITTKMLEIYK
ncbi:MAG: hypothetical protein K2H90_08655 [Oscillospiraceae bacterium]|nr:hypothetical protein [Oscillospiraceae bacterium]